MNRLYKSTEASDEAVLQMLSAGDSLMEAAVFLNIPSLVSAQVVQDANLFGVMLGLGQTQCIRHGEYLSAALHISFKAAVKICTIK